MTIKKAVSLIGMSGVGKTHISLKLAKWGWYHYSCDPEIGCNVLQDEVIESIKHDVMAHAQLRAYLESGAIKINNNITPENISTLSAYIGKIGNPTQGRLGNVEHGGDVLKEFKRRQRKYYEAECQVLLALKDKINEAESNGFKYFVNDTTGSICEIEDQEVLDHVGQNTSIVYIRASKEEEQEVITRSLKYPKPLYYPENRFDDWLNQYLKENNLKRAQEIEPDEFSRWVFPLLFQERIPKYQEIADKYGVVISSDDLRRVETEKDFLTLIEQ